MTKIQIERSYDFPTNMLRQTPEQNGQWLDLQFYFEAIEDCDYLICLNPPKRDIETKVPIQNRWLFIQEPYSRKIQWYSKTFQYFGKVFVSCWNQQYPNFEYSQTCLPWHLNKSYDDLKSLLPGTKKQFISAIISNIQTLPFQKKRFTLLKYLQADPDFHFSWFGKGVNYIEQKFDGIYPFRYSLAIENSSNEHYWTEKIADCYLSWTIPIYAGCKNLDAYFPEKSFISIDLNDFKGTREKLRSLSQSNYWEENYAALEEARSLVLDKYQLFPFIYDQIQQGQIKGFSKSSKTIIPNLWPQKTFFNRIFNKFNR